MTEDRFVYSTDPDEQAEIQRKARAAMRKPAASAVDVTEVVARIRMEKSGRGGKVVTIASGFPPNEAFLKDLTKRLKKACGTGGTHKIVNAQGNEEGVIEIQGDRREDVRAKLEAEGMRTKGK